MRNLWRLLVPLLLILALTSCLGGGGTNDNPAAGVEPDGQSLGEGEPLINDSFDVPTDTGSDTLIDDDFAAESTGTPDTALFGSHQDENGALLGGDTTGGALGVDATESSGDLFPDSTAEATPEP